MANELKKELTPEEKVLMNQVCDEWIAKIGNLPFNKEEAEKNIDWIYSLIDVKGPRKLHMSSPLAVQYAANMLKSLNDVNYI